MDFEYYNEDGEMYVCISVSRLEALEAYFAEEIINPKKWFKKFVIDNDLTQDFKNAEKNLKNGDKISITYLRFGEKHTVDLISK